MLLKTQFQLEILPQAMKQVAKLSEAVGEGRYEDLLEILGHHPDRSLPDGLGQDTNEEFRVVEGLLLADASRRNRPSSLRQQSTQ